MLEALWIKQKGPSCTLWFRRKPEGSRQGVARIRHPSGKILWIQALVLQQEVSVGQIPTAWNHSDVRTKPLAKNRRLALSNQLGASDAETLQSLGQEEYEIAAERTQNQQSLKRLSKAIFRMAAAWGWFPFGCRGNGGK
jgi:hypothetical protein